MNTPELTARQRDVIRFIRAFTAEKQYPPTLTEVSRAMGWASKTRAKQMVDRLAELGCVQWQPNQVRTLRVMESAPPC